MLREISFKLTKHGTYSVIVNNVRIGPEIDRSVRIVRLGNPDDVLSDKSGIFLPNPSVLELKNVLRALCSVGGRSPDDYICFVKPGVNVKGNYELDSRYNLLDNEGFVFALCHKDDGLSGWYVFESCFMDVEYEDEYGNVEWDTEVYGAADVCLKKLCFQWGLGSTFDNISVDNMF